jgi:hypothetical protein
VCCAIHASMKSPTKGTGVTENMLNQLERKTRPQITSSLVPKLPPPIAPRSLQPHPLNLHPLNILRLLLILQLLLRTWHRRAPKPRRRRRPLKRLAMPPMLVRKVLRARPDQNLRVLRRWVRGHDFGVGGAEDVFDDLDVRL